MGQQPKKKGQEKVSLKDYLLQKEQEAKKKKKTKLPLAVVIFLLTPLLIIFCFGIFYIPWMIYQIVTGKPAVEKSQTQTSTHQDNNQDK